MIVQVAFYKKPGTNFDKFVRWRTDSQYSHVELLIDGWGHSSSTRDGGVRRKMLDTGWGWDLYTIELTDSQALTLQYFFANTQGCRYDQLGLVGFLFGITALQHEDRYTCGEWCAAALGFDDPETFTPQKLLECLTERYQVTEVRIG